MSRNKTTIGYDKSPRTRIIRVAPITHAVRLALAASATVFALAGSGAALAQTCTDEANNTVYCDGAFAEPVAYENVDDLTVVLGANNPTSVTVADQIFGIQVSGTGMLGINSDADVTLSSPDTGVGLALLSTSSGGVVEALNTGNVVVEAAAGSTGIYAAVGGYAVGDVAHIANAGTLTSTTQNGRAFGILTRSFDATVNNSGSIVSTSEFGTANGIYMLGETVDVTNSGTILAGSPVQANGVTVYSDIGTNVSNSGSIVAATEGTSSWALGIVAASSFGDVTVTSGGDIAASSLHWGAFGIIAQGDDVNIRNSGDIEVESAREAYGIDAWGYSTGAMVYNRGTIAVDAAGRSVGMHAASYSGNATIVNTAAGDVSVSSGDGRAFGLQGQSAFGDVEINNAGDLTATGTYYGEGYGAIVVYGAFGRSNFAAARITNRGGIVADNAYGHAVGIYAEGASVTVNNSQQGIIAADSLTRATGIKAQGDSVVVNNAGSISASTADDDDQNRAGIALGIGVLGDDGTVDIAITNCDCGDITATAEHGFATGIYAGTYAEGSDIAIDNRGGISATTSWLGAIGIEVEANGAGSSVSVDNRGDIYAATNTAEMTYAYDPVAGGILVSVAGDASIRNSGTITAATADSSSPYGNPYGFVAFGILARADGDITVTSGGDIATSSLQEQAAGIVADGADVSVRNSGNIDVEGGTSAFGIGAQGVDSAVAYNRGTILADADHSVGAIASTTQGRAIVTNTAAGDISVTSGDSLAFGLVGQSQYGNVEINNVGALAATGTYYVDLAGNAFGADAVYGAFGRAAAGGLLIINRGDIEVSNAYGQAVGIDAMAQGNVAVHNTATGSISAEATGPGSEEVPPDAIGVRATSGARAKVTNDGAISASSAYGVAAGVVASGAVADVGNFGTIQTGGPGVPAAVGILAKAGVVASVDNGGTIITGDNDPLSVDDGFGILVVSRGTATVNNSGTVEAAALYATGIAVAGASGVEVNNSGSVRSVGWEYAHGITAVSSQGDVAVENSGLVDLTGNVRAGYAIQAFADAGDVAIRNAKTGVVRAVARVGSGIGIMGTSVTGDVAIDNAGSVEVINGNYAHYTYAIVGDSASGDVKAENSGELTVTNVNPYTNWVRGVLVNSDDGDVLVHNTGSIEVVASYSGVADGVRATSTAGDIEVRNDDTIAVSSTNSGETTPFAFGIYAATGEGAVLATNAGSITASSEEGFAIGIHAEGAETMVSNTAAGTIDVTAYLDATGIQVAGDIAMVDNAGLIEAAGGVGFAYASASTLGVLATGQALVSVDNTGRVEASGSPRTIAIYADANATGPEAIARVSNAGDIIATESSNYGLAAGIAAFSAGGVEVTNTGSIQSNSAHPFGIYAEGGDLDIVNAGTIAAIGSNSEYHYSFVIGILARAPVGGAGTVEITTLEGSSITAESLPQATGILAGGGNAIRIDNAGDISAVDDFDPDSGIDFGFGGSYGIRAGASVQTDIDNSGEITVDVTIGDATGIEGEAGSSVDIANDGLIDVHSDGVRRSINPGTVYGVRASGNGDATVVNNGDIDASIGFGTVFGIYARTAGDAAVRNDGTITVTGGNTLYYGDDIGIHVRSPDASIQVDNAGQIEVTATGSGLYAGVNAIGIFADGGEVMVTNTGSITTSSLGTSVGVATQGDVLTVVNHGDIHAMTATADPYDAIGVQMDATTSATFNNTGTITTTTANGVGSGVAVLIESDGAINFSNTGKLLGAVITRGGDDVVTGQAGSKWTLSRQTTDLGAGDDRIRNLFGSTLDLDSGRIVLGEGRNSFVNHGLVRVQGDSLIDMGRHAGTGDSRGWNPFVNNGVIDLAGASNDDRLTLAGDLAGRGAILVGLGGHGMGRGGLVVEGSVRPGSVQTVNVQFAGFDAIRQGARTDFAFVQRDSTAGSFVGGEVRGFEAGNFLELGVEVDSQIDASNQRDDVFSAGVQAEGLDDSGRLAASLGAGAQSLLAAQIGTWRQRSGVLSGHSPDRTMTGFVRSFGNAGEINPVYTGNAGQRSDFGFGQRNAGAEMGMHYQPAAGFSLGMRVGKSEGQQTLTGAGHGLNLIQADTFGVYGTWLSPKGLYVDTSVWRMDFDSRMQSSGSRHDVRGDASAANVETGYAFRLASGLRLEPSLQYTWTRMDGLSVQGSQAEFRSEAGDWRRVRAGVLAWKPVHGGSGITWTPYGSISVVHTDASGASYTVSDVFNGGTSMAGASTLLELGLGLRRRGFSANAGLSWTSGDTVGNALGGQLLLHYGW